MIIDPPGGWQYGFPKRIPQAELCRVREWLVENGYPQKEIDSLGDQFHYRCWEESEPSKEAQPSKAGFDDVRFAAGVGITFGFIGTIAAEAMLGFEIPGLLQVLSVLPISVAAYWWLRKQRRS